MATGLRSWSTTAASNATADANINWAEGMAPSAVNDSARQMMRSASLWREDNNGTITTGGTSTAYTATSNQGLAFVNGVTIVLQMNATNGATPTLNVDSLGAKSIQYLNGTAIATGALTANGIYQFTYLSSPDAWVVTGGINPAFASGTAVLFYQDTAPTGWTISTSLDDYCLRLVKGSGAGGGTGGATGGSTAFTSIFAARTIAAANLPNITMHTTVTDPGHVHSITSQATVSTNAGGGSGFVLWGTGGTWGTTNNTTGISVSSVIDNTARGSSQTTMDFAVRYASVIICTKN